MILYNQEFALKPGCRRQGYSRFALALQLRAAALAGIKSIVANAHGHKGIDFQGYAAWPELGFDGLIPQPIWNGLPKRELAKCGLDPERPIMIRELLAAGAGARHLWAEYGAGFLLSLSTDPGNPAAANMLNLLRRAKL